jgi:hypothetical protein
MLPHFSIADCWRSKRFKKKKTNRGIVQGTRLVRGRDWMATLAIAEVQEVLGQIHDWDSMQLGLLMLPNRTM